jgi:superfamily II DNA or RNA helicase
MSCAPSLAQIERYPVEFLRLILTAHGVRFDEGYDRYDLLSNVLLAYRMDCPKYTVAQVARIRAGRDVPHAGGSGPAVVSRLVPLQRECVEEMRRIAQRHYVLLNTSDPGSGKTIMGLAFSVLEGKSVYIVTKRNITPSWVKAIQAYGVTNVVGLTSYELGIRGKEYALDSRHRDGSWRAKPVRSPAITRTETTRKGKKHATLTWKGLRNTVIIFDEPHNSKNKASFAHQLLISCFEFVKRDSSAKNVLLLLGATPVDKQQNLSYLEQVLELKHERRRAARREEEEEGEEEQTPFLRLNKILYDPDDPRAARVSKEALEQQIGISPPVTVTIQAYEMSVRAQRVIEEQNQRIADLIRGINVGSASTKLVEILRARQTIELQKVPTFVNLAVDALQRGRSVIIFVEFYDTSNALAEALKRYEPRLLRGREAAPESKAKRSTARQPARKQPAKAGKATAAAKKAAAKKATAVRKGMENTRATSLKERQRILDAFQLGEFDLVIAHHQIAKEGVNMHDIVGGHPRTVIISPVWGGITFVQVLGRADRLCRLSDTEQFVVYAQSADPEKPGWDARVAEVMINKLRNIKELNIGEDADKFMRDLYEGAASVKRVDYKPRTVKLSASRFTRAEEEAAESELPGELTPEEASAEAEFVAAAGLSADQDRD